jgi:histidine triad (HIT) family protein
MDNCIFCKLAGHEIPADSVYEDDELFAFRDLNPAAPVHVLIIPKRHVANIADTTDADAALLGKIVRAATRIATELEIADSGYRIVANVGRDGGQSVDHLHLHLLGGRALAWPPG